MILTLAEVRRRLTPGTEYIGELLGPAVAPAMKVPMRRKVVKCSSYDLVSELLDGPNQGRQISLGTWKEVMAREENGSIILYQDKNSQHDAWDVLKITVTPKEGS